MRLAVCIPVALVMMAGTALADQTVSEPEQKPESTQPAAAPATSNPTPAPNAQPADDQDKVVCRREQMPGTRIGGKRICLTQREWDQIARDSRETLRETQDKSLRSNPTSGKGS
jgi:hypothetical protein